MFIRDNRGRRDILVHLKNESKEELVRKLILGLDGSILAQFNNQAYIANMHESDIGLIRSYSGVKTVYTEAISEKQARSVKFNGLEAVVGIYNSILKQKDGTITPNEENQIRSSSINKRKYNQDIYLD